MGATLQLLELMGPSPPAIPPDSLAGLLVRSFRGTPPDIRTAAFDALAASPEFAAVGSLELQRGLTGWRNLTDERRRRRQMSADQLERTLTYMERAGAAGHVNVQSRVGVIPPSRFPMAVRDLLSDPVFQGIVGSMGVLKAQVCQDDVRRRGAAEDLIQLVSAELER